MLQKRNVCNYPVCQVQLFATTPFARCSKSTLMNQQQVSHLVNGYHRQHGQTRQTYFKQYFCELFWQQYDSCREADLGGLIWRHGGHMGWG